MNALAALTLASVLATAFALVLVTFLRRPLHLLLIELCGNDARARFWSVYWAAIIVLCALFGLLATAPFDELELWTESPAVPIVLSGFRGSLFAVLLVLGLLALVLLRSIASFESGRRPRPSLGPKDAAVQG